MKLHFYRAKYKSVMILPPAVAVVPHFAVRRKCGCQRILKPEKNLSYYQNQVEKIH